MIASAPLAGGWARARRRAYLAGLVPALLVLTAITLLPALYLVVTSLTPLNLTNPATFLEFSAPAANYQDLLADDRFLNSVLVQAKLSLASVSLQLLVGLGVALLLN